MRLGMLVVVRPIVAVLVLVLRQLEYHLLKHELLQHLLANVRNRLRKCDRTLEVMMVQALALVLELALVAEAVVDMMERHMGHRMVVERRMEVVLHMVVVADMMAVVLRKLVERHMVVADKKVRHLDTVQQLVVFHLLGSKLVVELRFLVYRVK